MASISQLYNTFSKDIPATDLTVAKKEEHILSRFMAMHIKSIEEDAKNDADRRSVHL